jgi:hypothetical protein
MYWRHRHRGRQCMGTFLAHFGIGCSVLLMQALKSFFSFVSYCVQLCFSVWTHCRGVCGVNWLMNDFEVYALFERLQAQTKPNGTDA